MSERTCQFMDDGEVCGMPARFSIEPENWDDEDQASVGNIWLCADHWNLWVDSSDTETQFEIRVEDKQ